MQNNPVAEDTTHFGDWRWRNYVGAGQEVSFLLPNFQSMGRFSVSCWWGCQQQLCTLLSTIRTSIETYAHVWDCKSGQESQLEGNSQSPGEPTTTIILNKYSICKQLFSIFLVHLFLLSVMQVIVDLFLSLKF